MLRTASGIKGYAILASDGKIGTVGGFLFDDDSWLVRWLVVDTGNWLSDRKVLLPPFALSHPDPSKRVSRRRYEELVARQGSSDRSGISA
jgi:hypothetical protein